MKRLDAELRREHGITVTEFDVLTALSDAPDRRLRMSALSARVLLSPAGVTHMVTRLERDGFVRREVDPSDRRKWFTVLTAEGEAVLRAARLTHSDALRRTLFASTSGAERRALQRVWRRLADTRPDPVG